MNFCKYKMSFHKIIWQCIMIYPFKTYLVPVTNMCKTMHTHTHTFVFTSEVQYILSGSNIIVKNTSITYCIIRLYHANKYRIIKVLVNLITMGKIGWSVYNIKK